MTNQEKEEVKQNKVIRGYICRCLYKGNSYRAAARHVSSSLYTTGLIISPDVSKHLQYLETAGYIKTTDEKITAYRAFAEDAVLELTKEGIDLVEGTLEDEGIEV